MLFGGSACCGSLFIMLCGGELFVELLFEGTLGSLILCVLTNTARIVRLVYAIPSCEPGLGICFYRAQGS